jgi:O-antigen/teichoic acid export membrane protein
MRGYVALVILAAGQLFNVAIGPVGWLLVMTGHQGYAALVLAASTGLNVILNFLFIPKWGLEGAAVATTISTVLGNLFLAVIVYRRLGIHGTVLGSFSAGKNKVA